MQPTTAASSCCCSSLLGLGLTIVFAWLIFRPLKPIYSIESFYVPALDKTITTTGTAKLNSNISFDLRLKNRNFNKGIYYDTLNITLYYGKNLSSPIGGISIPGFYQGYHKKAHRVETVGTVGVPWETAKKDVSGGEAVFRVDLATRIRFKYPAYWKTHRQTMKLGVDVKVNDDGKKSSKSGVVLSSAAVNLGDTSIFVAITVLVINLFLLF